MRTYFEKCEPIKENPGRFSRLRCASAFVSGLSVFLVLFVSVSERIYERSFVRTDGVHKYCSLYCILVGTVIYHLAFIPRFLTQAFCKVALVQFVGCSLMLLGLCWEASLAIPDLNDRVDPGYFWISRIQIVVGGSIALTTISMRVFHSMWPYVDAILFSVGRMHTRRYLDAMDIEARGDLKPYSSRSSSCETDVGEWSNG